MFPSSPGQFSLGNTGKKQGNLSSKDLPGLIQVFTVVSSIQQIGHFYLSQTLHQVRQHSSVYGFEVNIWV